MQVMSAAHHVSCPEIHSAWQERHALPAVPDAMLCMLVGEVVEPKCKQGAEHRA